MSQKHDHLYTLKRRLSFLEKKLSEGKTSQNAESYLRAEIGALRWAVSILEMRQLKAFEAEAHEAH